MPPTSRRYGKRRPHPLLAAAAAAILLLLLASARRRSWALDRAPPTSRRELTRTAAARRTPSLLAYVGVFTAAAVGGAAPDGSQYDYAARRAAARAGWFPADRAARDAAERDLKVRVRFVVGEAANAAATAALAAEEEAAGGALFLRVAGVADRYDELPRKTAAFLAAALADAPHALYILKVDDDVFVRLDRVPAAVAQWRGLARGAGADAVGCAKNGPVFADPALRWHEPAAPLLGPTYFTHFWGPAYALSASAAATVVEFEAALHPRRLANEDTTLGLWLLALGASHYDDRRLCSPACDESAVAVYDYPECAGLCDPARQLRDLATTCVGGGTEPPLVPELIAMDGL